MKTEGSATVEAALIFPVIFIMLMAFMEFAIYFAVLEYSQSVCESGILMAKSKDASEGEIAQSMNERLEGIGLVEEKKAWIEKKNYLAFSKIRASVSGSCRLIFPMKIEVTASAYQEDPPAFCRTVDLIWECADRLGEAKSFIDRWYGGE